MDLEALCRASSVVRPTALLLLVTEDIVIPMDTLYGVLDAWIQEWMFSSEKIDLETRLFELKGYGPFLRSPMEWLCEGRMVRHGPRDENAVRFLVPLIRPAELTDRGSNPLRLKFSPRTEGTDFVGVAKRVGDIFELKVTALMTDKNHGDEREYKQEVSLTSSHLVVRTWKDDSPPTDATTPYVWPLTGEGVVLHLFVHRYGAGTVEII